MENTRNTEENGLVILAKNILSRFSPKPAHRCSAARYEPTGEVLKFYWEVPWCFTQEFTVCEDCRRVNVISETQHGAALNGTYRKERHGEKWSGECDYALVPSTGNDKLTLRKKL